MEGIIERDTRGWSEGSIQEKERKEIGFYFFFYFFIFFGVLWGFLSIDE